MPNPVILKNAMHDPGLLIQDCLSTQLGHDLKIVCQDGIILWSSVLMSQWSQLTRKLLTEDYMPILRNNNIILIMPDVKLTTMKLVLNWSVTGHIELENQNIMDEVISVLRCFDCCIQVSVEPMDQDIGEIQTDPLAVPDVIEIEVEKKEILEVDLALEEDENKTKANSSSLVRSNECVDVNESALDDNDLDICDIDEVEYSREGKKRLNAGEVPKHPSCQGSFKHESDMDGETGNADSWHGSMSEASPTSSSSLELKRQNNCTSIMKNHKIEDGNPSNKFKCLLCGANNQSYLNLLCHLSLKHYKNELLNLFGTDDTRCPFCKKILHQNKDKNVVHVGTGHKQLLSVVPENVRTQLIDMTVHRQTRQPKMATWKRCKSQFLTKKGGWPCCQDFTNSLQELSLHLASVHYERKLVSAYGAVSLPCKQCPTGSQYRYVAEDRENIVKHMVSSHSNIFFKLIREKCGKLLQGCLNANYECSICKGTFVSYAFLKSHLCRNHFKEEILMAGKFHEDCKVCKNLALKNNCYATRCETARHWGRTHGYLDQVLPESIKKFNKIQCQKNNKRR